MNNIDRFNNQQKMKSYFYELLGFLVIFSVLAGVIYITSSRMIYQTSDRGLKDQARFVRQMTPQPTGSGSLANANNQNNPVPFHRNDKADVLVYSKSGKLLNADSLGDVRAEIFKSWQAPRQSKREIVKQTTIQKQTYRYQVVSLPQRTATLLHQDADHAVVIQNFSDQNKTLQDFRGLLFISFLLAGLLAIIVSWWTTKRNMQPIIDAWHNQQDFVDSAAHELKTPLTVIQNKLELILAQPNAKVRDVSEGVVLSLSEIRRLNQLTNDMLTLAKSNSNMTLLELESVPINQTIEEIIAPYIELAASEEKQLDAELLEQELTFSMDKKRLHQLLVILLDNALKYTAAGDTIAVRATVQKKQLLLEVADTGNGISDTAKQHVFDRFYREEKSGNRKTGGTGLGLSIAKWIVEEHRGTIVVVDNQPKGARFIVRLPIRNNS